MFVVCFFILEKDEDLIQKTAESFIRRQYKPSLFETFTKDTPILRKFTILTGIMHGEVRALEITCSLLFLLLDPNGKSISNLKNLYNGMQEQMKNGLIYVAGERFRELIFNLIDCCESEMKTVCIHYIFFSFSNFNFFLFGFFCEFVCFFFQSIFRSVRCHLKVAVQLYRITRIHLSKYDYPSNELCLEYRMLTASWWFHLTNLSRSIIKIEEDFSNYEDYNKRNSKRKKQQKQRRKTVKSKVYSFIYLLIYFFCILMCVCVCVFFFFFNKFRKDLRIILNVRIYEI